MHNEMGGLSMYKILIFVLSFVASIVSYAAPVNIEGTAWVVKKAEINTELTRTLQYQYNDDRLVGRVITFNKGNIEANLPEDTDCQQPEYKESKSTVDGFIKSTIGEADSASAKSYELDVNGKENVFVLTPECHKGTFGDINTGRNSKLAIISNNKMLINWYDGTILVMAPLDSKEKPKPSFSCSNAKSASEKTICSDYELSSYDKSIDNAWKEAKDLARSSDNQYLSEKVTSTQKKWLKERNSCGDDKVCLKNNMKKRLEEISSMANGE